VASFSTSAVASTQYGMILLQRHTQTKSMFGALSACNGRLSEVRQYCTVLHCTSVQVTVLYSAVLYGESGDGIGVGKRRRRT